MKLAEPTKTAQEIGDMGHPLIRGTMRFFDRQVLTQTLTGHCRLSDIVLGVSRFPHLREINLLPHYAAQIMANGYQGLGRKPED
jgi:hypothetical protein